jgi:hypothetical protein
LFKQIKTNSMANGRGGIRAGQGRPTKASELALIERLSPMDDVALQALQEGVNQGKYEFIKLFFEYRWSKPRQELSVDGDLLLSIPAPVIYNTAPPLANNENDIENV